MKKIINIKNLPEDKKIIEPIKNKEIIISTITSKFTEFKKLYRKKNKKRKIFYGQLLTFESINDFINGDAAWSYPAKPKPGFCYSGIAVYEDKIFACNKNLIEVFYQNRKIKEIKNRLFNDLHYICFSPNKKNLLITSSGTDSIIELSLENYSELWKWTAYDSNLNKYKKYLDDVDYSKLHISTLKQITHINSAFYINLSKLIGATLFHQGNGIIIDYRNKKYKIIISGLENPHGFFKFYNNYLVTNTSKGEVYILNENFKKTIEIKNFNKNKKEKIWLQNTFYVNHSILVVINQNVREIIFIDFKKEKKFTVKHNLEWKIYQIIFK